MPAAKRSITINDLWALKRVGTGSLSPDGQWTCATVTGYSMEKNESTTQLWLLSTDVKVQRQLTRGNLSKPRVSPRRSMPSEATSTRTLHLRSESASALQ